MLMAGMLRLSVSWSILLLSPPAAAALAHFRTLDELAELARAAHGDKLGAMLDPPHQHKIEHFVVLLKENRAFDHIAGCMGEGCYFLVFVPTM
eukprot:SAG31_NODE_9999_length_1198_cov_1.257507_1_plen_93_part_00